VGYALLKAKSSKILEQDGTVGGDESAEGICSLYVKVTLYGSWSAPFLLN